MSSLDNIVLHPQSDTGHVELDVSKALQARNHIMKRYTERAKNCKFSIAQLRKRVSKI